MKESQKVADLVDKFYSLVRGGGGGARERWHVRAVRGGGAGRNGVGA